MEIELVEIRDFLAQYPPFDVLPDDLLDELPGSLHIRYLRRNSVFPASDQGEPALQIVRSGAIELRNDSDQLVEKLGEGNIYSTPCHLLDFSGSSRGVAVEDTLLYLLPCSALKNLCVQSPTFDEHFSQSVRDRLKGAVSQTQPASALSSAQMSIEVAELIRRQPVMISADSTIRDVAQLMTEKQVSSAMVMEGDELVGLVTDSDLRTRCIAEGVSVDRPTRDIMTTGVRTLEHNTLLVHALINMTRQQIHHMPVMRDERLIGMLTTTDLSRYQSTNSAFIATDVHRARSVDDLVQACKRLPDLQVHLAGSSATALHIGESVSALTDAVTVRLIELAIAELGPAPVPFCWVAGGSQSRREQTSHSDQDNALIIADTMQPEHEAWFESLSHSVSDGLHACGYIYCPGEAMATNPKWRQPLNKWQQYFDDWINKPEPMALMLASIFFDLSPVYGDKSLFKKLQRRMLDQTRNSSIFIAHMAANALQHRPPLGFFRTFVLIHDGEHDETFDIKHNGIVPITDLARVFALNEGLKMVNTTDRLRAAAGTPSCSEEMAENLEDALEFIASLRINHQAEQIHQGVAPDNFLSPNSLSELERTHLKYAFKVIKSMQDTLEHRYPLG